MTAKDLVTLAKHTIQDFPEFFHYYSEKNFVYNGISQDNRNPLLDKNLGVDGLKTGHTKRGGFGLVVSAERKGRRLILVLNGLPNIRARTKESERLLEWGFLKFNNYRLFSAGDTVSQALARFCLSSTARIGPYLMPETVTPFSRPFNFLSFTVPWTRTR